jgi:aspartyl protease family protein
MKIQLASWAILFVGVVIMRRAGPLPSVGLAVLFMAVAGFPGLQPNSDIPELRLMAITELTAGGNGHFVTDASINGSTVKVLVDTGASAVALSYQDAEKIGLKPRTLDFDVRVMTANGEGKAAKVKLKQVMIDNVKVRDVEGLVLQDGAMNGTLLGMSFLGRLKSFTMSDGKLTLKN